MSHWDIKIKYNNGQISNVCLYVETEEFEKTSGAKKLTVKEMNEIKNMTDFMNGYGYGEVKCTKVDGEVQGGENSG